MATRLSSPNATGRASPGKTSYAIKRPDGKRRSFAIQAVTAEGKRTTLHREDVDAVNKLFADGVISATDADRKIEAIRDRLYMERDAHQPTLVFQSQNAKTVDGYFDDVYSARDVVNPEGRKRDLMWAVEHLGALSLASASQKEMQSALDKHPGLDNNQQRRAVSRINQLLQWVGRDFVLRKKRELHRSVRFLTWEEFLLVDAQLRDPEFRLLCRAFMATGCRPGELFPLTPADNHGVSLWVETQYDRKLDERPTKNRKKRKAFVITEGRQWVNDWIALEGKEEQRCRSHANMFKRACRKAFPKHPDKHCVFYDLRHSYAIHLLSRLGAPIHLVANSLGNMVSVCEKYYAGFVLTDAGLDFLEKLSSTQKPDVPGRKPRRRTS